MCNKISINDWCMKNTQPSQFLLFSLAKIHNPMLKLQYIRPLECFPICRCCTGQQRTFGYSIYRRCLCVRSSQLKFPKMFTIEKEEKSMTGPSHLAQLPSEMEQVTGGNVQSLWRPSLDRCCKLDELVPEKKKYEKIQLY